MPTFNNQDPCRRMTSKHVCVVCLLILLVVVDCTIIQNSFQISCSSSSCLQSSNNPAYCYCDPSCTTYGDCCHDANVTARPPLNPKFSCVVPGGSGSSEYWTITTCSRSWITEQLADGVVNVNDVVSSCEDPSVRASFRFLPPVTDEKTGFVYRNEFCAKCNGLQSSHVSRWRTQLSCQDSRQLGVPFTNDLNFGELFDFCSVGSYLPPESSMNPRVCRPPPPGLVVSCPEGVSMDHMQKCTQGGINLIEVRQFVYANEHCASCWNVSSITSDFCLLPLVSTALPDPDPYPGVGNLAVLLDISGTGVRAISSSATFNIVEEVCPSGSVYDVFRGSCRMLPSANCTNSTAITLEGGAYSLRGTDSVLWISYNLNVSIESVDNNGRPLVCIPSVESSACVPIILANGEYMLHNTTSRLRTLVWALDNGIYQIEGYNANGNPLICTSLPQNYTVNSTIDDLFGYPIAFDILTYIGMSIDIVCCCLFLFTFLVFKELRSFFSKLLVNFILSILLGDVLFLVGGPLLAFLNIKPLCTAVAILLHYVFLCRFSWMTVMCLELVRRFYNLKKLNKSAVENWKLLSLYMLVGWLSPLVIVIPTIVVNFTVDNSVNYGVGNSCWINQATALIVSFLVPVGVSIVFNTCTFIAVIIVVACVRHHPIVSSSPFHLKEYWKQLWKDVRFAFAVFTLTGLSWLFGFLALLSRDLSWAWYPFIIFNTTQALAISVAFLFTKKVFQFYRSAFKKHCLKKDKANGFTITISESHKMQAV